MNETSNPLPFSQGNGEKGEKSDTSTSASTSAALTIRNIRIQEGLARFAGSMERYQHWLNEFITYGPAATAEIRRAISDEAHEPATRLAHALKGRTGMLGMVELHAICLALEMALKNGEPPSLWLEELEISVQEMSKDITAALKQN